MTVDTSGRTGPFIVNGEIVWTNSNNHLRNVILTIRGEVLPPLQCKPEVLIFEPEEVRNGIVKDLILTSNVPLDWNSLNLSRTAQYAQVLDVQVKEQSVICKVKSIVPEGLESFEDKLIVTARVANASGVLAGELITRPIPVIIKQAVDLLIIPTTLTVTLRGAEDRATARFMLRGERLTQGQSIIRSISCDGFRVEWKMGEPTASNTAIVKVVLMPTGSSLPSQSELLIELEGQSRIRVPVSQVRLPYVEQR